MKSSEWFILSNKRCLASNESRWQHVSDSSKGLWGVIFFSLDHLDQNESTHVNSNGKYYSILNGSERVTNLRSRGMIGGWIGIQFEKKTNLSNTLRTQETPRISEKSSSNWSCLPFLVFFRFTKMPMLLNSCRIDLILTSTCKALHKSGVVRLLVRNWWKSTFSPLGTKGE